MIQGIDRWWTLGISLYFSTRLSSINPFSHLSNKLSWFEVHKHYKHSFFSSSTTLFVSPSKKESNFPDRDELSRQKAEVLESISDFHDGTWICKDGALSFSISTDVAAGITAKRISVPYTASVSLRVGPSDDYESSNIRLIETFSWNSTISVSSSSIGSSSSCFAVRTIPLDKTVDVDSVDSSYSLDILLTDSSSSPIPGVISGQTASTDCVFFIEKVLALSNQERIRLFILYKEDKHMTAVSQTSFITEDELNCKLERVVICHESRVDSTNTVMVQPNDPIHVLEPVSMFTLSLGPWLGDLVVRDQSIHSDRSIGFAEWMIGVQKVSIRFDYDFEFTVKNYIDYGRALGVSAHTNMPLFSKGIMNENAMSRRIPLRERIMYIDYDFGSYAAFLLGSVYLKAPRFMTVAKGGGGKSDSGQPHKHTEFIAFHRDESSIQNGSNKQELYCSRITRLYTPQGRFLQGSTSFFILQPRYDEN